MAIPEDYRNALNSWAGTSDTWYANWPIAEGHVLGELGRMHGDSYVFERKPNFSFEVDKATVTLSSWSYQNGSDMSVQVGLDASVPGFEFLAGADAGIRAEFGSTKGVYVSASGGRIDRVADVPSLRGELKAAGQNGSLGPGSALVLATLSTDKALVLTSNSSNAVLEARAKANLAAVPGVPADLAGNLSVVRGSAAVDLQDYHIGRVVLAMRLLVLVRRGWLWWRRLDVLGATPPSNTAHLDLLEAMSEDTD